MGYHTEFQGSINIDPPLNEHEVSFLEDFANTRRMKRKKGPYFVKGEGFKGKSHNDEDVIDFNTPPDGQPGVWCQWVPGEDGTVLEWDQGEKFYNAPEWMVYLINHFLKPGADASVLTLVDADERFRHFTFDHVLNGEIYAQGEEPDDQWMLVVRGNNVYIRDAIIEYGNEREV